MENDSIDTTTLDHKENNNFCVFKMDYIGQNLKNNPDFQKWKVKMLKIYGKDAKLFACLIDNIYFYTSNDEYKRFPYYLCECPLCKTPSCYFCSKYCDDSFLNGNCCCRRRIRCMIVQDGLIFINPVGKSKNPQDFSQALGIFYLPVLNFFLLFKGK